MELMQHPLSAAFPAMSADDFQALKGDIENTGQREPVMLFEGMVLDGWHRYRACTELGLPVEKFTFAADGDPVAFVLSHNLHRRHLTASQRAAAVVACAEWVPPHRQKKGEMVSPLSKTNADMAKAASVSDRTIKDAKAAHKAGLTEVVTAGAMTAQEAAAVARGTPEKPKKAKAEAQAPAAPEPNAEELAEAHQTITSLSEENDQLRDRIGVEAMDASEEEKTQTAETIRELRALVKTLEAENAALKSSRDQYMTEATQAKKDAIYWRKKAGVKA